MNVKLYRTILFSVVSAAIVSVACGADNANKAEPNATATTGSGAYTSAAVSGPTSLTGCLQKDSGLLGDYILTQTNAPAETVGTSGAGTVERRQLDAAARSYRLSGESSKLRDLVGHQIRVTGSMTDQASLAGDKSSERPAEVKDSNLAKFEVASVESVAEACASGPARSVPPNN
jgi:hypothetical protein